MAKITQVHISGKLPGMNNVVAYQRNGKTILRTQAENVKLTEATLRTAKSFASAVPVGKFLRQGLSPAMPVLKKKKEPEYRLNEALSKALRAIDPGVSNNNPAGLHRLEFNHESRLFDRFNVDTVTDWSQPGLVTFALPALNPVTAIKAPLGTQRIYCRIAVAGSSLRNPMITGSYTTAFDLAYSDELQEARLWTLPVTVQPGSINVLMLKLQYVIMKKGIVRNVTDLRWQPAAIVSAWYQSDK